MLFARGPNAALSSGRRRRTAPSTSSWTSTNPRQDARLVSSPLATRQRLVRALWWTVCTTRSNTCAESLRFATTNSGARTIYWLLPWSASRLSSRQRRQYPPRALASPQIPQSPGPLPKGHRSQPRAASGDGYGGSSGSSSAPHFLSAKHELLRCLYSPDCRQGALLVTHSSC